MPFKNCIKTTQASLNKVSVLHSSQAFNRPPPRQRPWHCLGYKSLTPQGCLESTAAKIPHLASIIAKTPTFSHALSSTQALSNCSTTGSYQSKAQPTSPTKPFQTSRYCICDTCTPTASSFSQPQTHHLLTTQQLSSLRRPRRKSQTTTKS